MASYFWICCACTFVISSALNLPDLNSVFGSFYSKLRPAHDLDNVVKEEEHTSARERVKRQNPDLGDESQLHYLVKSGRYDVSN